MALNSTNLLEKIGDSCVDIFLFTGVGYLCGRVVNYVHGWNLKDKIFNKSHSYVDLKTLARCCILFIIIDRVFQAVFNQQFGHRDHSPAYIIPRISLSLAATIGLVNGCATAFKYTSLDQQAALVTLLISIIAYAQLLNSVKTFDSRTISS